MQYRTEDLRIESITAVVPPAQLHEEFPLTQAAARTTYETREGIRRILHGEDHRLLVVVGPCSIHDPVAALDYGSRLQAVTEQLCDALLIVMRVYFEKPRTTVGWKGLINDPDLDGTFHINKGLRLARKLLLDLNEMGVPAGVEYLDVITPQYVSDLVSWGAIGARTTESQIHRELASGLSCPVGFKNGTDGNIKIAVDAIRAATKPHHFLSLTKEAHSAIFSTTGNPDCHIILRGGVEPNHDEKALHHAADALQAAGLPIQLMVDFSHANSQKKYGQQLAVGRDVAQKIALGDQRLIGIMVESNITAGRQDVEPGKELVYGQSITDACIGWDDTLPLLDELAEASRQRHQGIIRERASSRA